MHLTSSPHYPQSNGKAEAAVKSIKKHISAAWTGCSVDWTKLSRALLQYRNTPTRKNGISPAQKLFGHPVQDTLPAHRRSFALEWQKSTSEDDKLVQETEEKSSRAYNQQAHPLRALHIGNHVTIQHPTNKLWDTYGTITCISPNRKYFVKTQGGRVLVRNRRFLRKRCPASISAPIPTVLEPTPNPPKPTPRRSTRVSHRPEYFAQDSRWMSSSYEPPSQELGRCRNMNLPRTLDFELITIIAS